MQVGIVGLGIVGTANRIGFEQLGHDVKCHDIKFKTNIDIVKAVALNESMRGY